MKLKCRSRELVVAGALIFASLAIIKTLPAQPLDKMRLGYSGTGINNYVLEMGKFNHVYLAAPSITSFKQLKGKKVAVSRVGSGSHFQTNLALKEGGIDPEKDVTVLQIGNSGARITAILSGVVDGAIMAADFVPAE
jgi:ABC-type nitrate/sulfonate/bicarbonate transport system substrate-binding protein